MQEVLFQTKTYGRITKIQSLCKASVNEGGGWGGGGSDTLQRLPFLSCSVQALPSFV
jgi:hypothetical protein